MITPQSMVATTGLSVLGLTRACTPRYTNMLVSEDNEECLHVCSKPARFVFTRSSRGWARVRKCTFWLFLYSINNAC
jgi:hypothetical protein